MIPIMFLHGLDSSSQGDKACRLRQAIPDLVTPDFSGSLPERMAQLQPLLAARPRWMLIGSSFGGLMAALYALDHPDRVERLILMAPALHHPEFQPHTPVDVPTLWIHGTSDSVVPFDQVAGVVPRAFHNLTGWVVADDHRLRTTTSLLDWPALLDPERIAPWRSLTPPATKANAGRPD